MLRLLLLAALLLALLPAMVARAGSSTWQALSPLPTARVSLGAATSHGVIYAAGGTAGGTRASPTDTVEAFDPVSGAWVTAPSLQTPRAALAVAADRDGRIYAIGGYDSSSTILKSVERYDPASGTWTFVAPLHVGRYAAAATLGPDGRIYVMGGISGIDAQKGYLVENSVEAYDPATNTWSTVASMPTARAELAAAVGSDGHVYALGGYVFEQPRAHYVATVESYDPAQNRWTAAASLPQATGALAAASGPDGYIYALGGLISQGPTASVYIYTPRTNTWTAGPPLPAPRYALAAASGPAGALYVVGGATYGSNHQPIPSDQTDALAMQPAAATPTIPTAPPMATAPSPQPTAASPTVMATAPPETPSSPAIAIVRAGVYRCARGACTRTAAVSLHSTVTFMASIRVENADAAAVTGRVRVTRGSVTLKTVRLRPLHGAMVGTARFRNLGSRGSLIAHFRVRTLAAEARMAVPFSLRGR